MSGSLLIAPQLGSCADSPGGAGTIEVRGDVLDRGAHLVDGVPEVALRRLDARKSAHTGLREAAVVRTASRHRANNLGFVARRGDVDVMLFGMTDQPPSLRTLRFDRFELQLRERRLLADGCEVPIGARAFDLLGALVRRSGQLVTKNELLDEVWSGLVVEEANLSVQVSALRKVLGDELIATIPGRGYRFTGRVDEMPADVPASPDRYRNDAPQQSAAVPMADAVAEAQSSDSTLIGRQVELAELLRALATPGCVTLVGPAGVGKTTLARALATRVPQGAVWVDLAPLADGGQLIAAVARALGAIATDGDVTSSLLAKLGARLLVLDNGEHVVEAAAALVGQLVKADASIRVLATSQLRLAVSGERVHRIEPLALPLDSDALDLHRGAVALFVERARAADHHFHPTATQLPLLREICRRLDGLPLALEMAAARVPALGLTGLAHALEWRFALLKGGQRDAAARHRTLQAALNWSHDLLSLDEQRVYRQCGVFSGGFTLELLVGVCSGLGASAESRWAVVETLAQLTDRSLVAVGEGDPPRYRLLETMREDARQRLQAAGEESEARSRLLAVLAAIGQRCIDADRAAPTLREPLLAEHDNLRESIAWGRQQADERVRTDTVATATATAFAAVYTPWRQEAMQWLESCEPLTEDPALPPPVRVRWWYERSRQWLISKHKDATAMAERTRDLARASGDELGEFNALSILVRAPGGPDDALVSLCEAMRTLMARHPEWGPARALSLAGAEARCCDRLGDGEGLLRCRLRELELVRQLGDTAAAAAVETNLVFALQELGRHEEALERARTLLDRLDDPEGSNAAYAWTGLIVSLQALRRFDEFRAVLPRAAHVLRLHGLPLVVPQCVLVLAGEGHTTEALQALGYARALFASKGMRMTGAEVTGLQALESQARCALGDAAVDLCLAEGATLDEDAADALMLRAARPATSPADARG